MRIISLTILGLAVLFQLKAQSEYCGAGTIWDTESQTCIAAENAELLDSDLDGIIGVEDLLNLLSHFGDEDMDFDGIYDSVDDCVGAYDECGVCNGDGPQIPVIDEITVLYDSLYAEAIDEWWVFEVGVDTTFTFVCEIIEGCIDEAALNFMELANTDDASCIFPFEACGDPVFWDSYTYATVEINDECWLAENLRSTIFQNGDPVTHLVTASEWLQETAGMSYNSSFSGCTSYGTNRALYNGYAIIDDRGLCPTDWEIPSELDWIDMVNSLDGFSDSTADQLKSADGWGNHGGNNLTGFSAIPEGVRGNGGCFHGSEEASFWTSTLLPTNWGLTLANINIYGQTSVADIVSGYDYLIQGKSIRCIKN